MMWFLYDKANSSKDKTKYDTKSKINWCRKGNVKSVVIAWYNMIFSFRDVMTLGIILATPSHEWGGHRGRGAMALYKGLMT